MNQRLWTNRVYERGMLRRQSDENFDVDDEDALRVQLERAVKAAAGTLNLNLSEWELRVHSLGGGMIQRFVSVDAAGQTQVRR